MIFDINEMQKKLLFLSSLCTDITTRKTNLHFYEGFMDEYIQETRIKMQLILNSIQTCRISEFILDLETACHHEIVRGNQDCNIILTVAGYSKLILLLIL